jgi:hypothetical protein
MSKNTAEYKLDDEVTWCGVKGDDATRHRGKIVSVVAAYSSYPVPMKPVMEALARKFHAVAPKDTGGSRPHKSYIVLVPGETTLQKSRLYYPYVSRLELVSRPKESNA